MRFQHRELSNARHGSADSAENDACSTTLPHVLTCTLPDLGFCTYDSFSMPKMRLSIRPPSRACSRRSWAYEGRNGQEPCRAFRIFSARIPPEKKHLSANSHERIDPQRASSAAPRTTDRRAPRPKAEHVKGVSVSERVGARATTYGARYTLRDGKRPVVKPPSGGWVDRQQAFKAACSEQRAENLRTDNCGGQLMRRSGSGSFRPRSTVVTALALERGARRDQGPEEPGPGPHRGQRNPQGRVDFLRRGTRPPTPLICAFIDEQRALGRGVEPICTQLSELGLPVAPRTYRAWKTSQACSRARSDAALLDMLLRVRTGGPEVGRWRRSSTDAARRPPGSPAGDSLTSASTPLTA